MTKYGVPLPRTDHRTQAAIRFAALADSYAEEIGQPLGEADKALIAQAAAMQLRIDALQLAIVEGQDVDADSIVRLSSEHRRLLTSLRARASKRKPIAPSIDDIFSVAAADA